MASIGSTTGTTTGQTAERADVELRVPADSAYASVLRTTTAGLAARLDFPIDDIEDLRIAVSEASAMVLPAASADADLTCEFFMRPGAITVSLGVPVDNPVDPQYDSFAWQVLTTLATDATADTGGGRFTVSVTMEPGNVGSGA
jgi:serine/threonine-protein kinase RsbW